MVATTGAHPVGSEADLETMQMVCRGGVHLKQSTSWGRGPDPPRPCATCSGGGVMPPRHDPV